MWTLFIDDVSESSALCLLCGKLQAHQDSVPSLCTPWSNLAPFTPKTPLFTLVQES